MTKADLIDKVQQAEGMPELTKKSTADVVEAVFEALKAAIAKDERFSFPGFGTFNLKKRKGRTGRNPRTGASIKIKASKSVSFHPAPSFKESL